MSVFDDIKAKADQNGDGKLTKADLESLRGRIPADKVDELKKVADQNNDGKVDLEDVKKFNLGETINEAKDALSGLFK